MDVATEKRLVEMIQKGGRLRDQALSTIYNDSGIKEKLTHMISKNHGNMQDGEDLYQESMIVLDKNIRSGDFRVEGSLKSYLYSIGKYLWMNHLRKKSLTLKENFYDHELISTKLQPDNLMIDEQRKDYLKNILSLLGQKCQNILELWQLSYSMEEIAASLNLNDASSARKAKYDCQQQLIRLIQSNPQLKKELK